MLLDMSPRPYPNFSRADRFCFMAVSCSGWFMAALASGFRASELHQPVIGRLRLHLAIEQQRMIGASADGEVVLPGNTVVQSPEGDPLHGIAMAQQDAEQFCIAIGQLPLRGFGQAIAEGIILARVFGTVGDLRA